MRLGVLDIGSNTGHLLVVDAHAGAAPLPAYSFKEPLRLAEHLDDEGRITDTGIVLLTRFCAAAMRIAEEKGCAETYAFATSAVREAVNGESVLRHVDLHAGVSLEVLPGKDEARLTFLAARRWFGWSSGRLAVFDMGGGSLEIAAGLDEDPEIALSLPLGAARVAKAYLSAASKRPTAEAIEELRARVRSAIRGEAQSVESAGFIDHAVGTSKTFRSLARICGAAPRAEGPYVKRYLPLRELQRQIPKLTRLSRTEIVELPGVSPDRAHQIVPGAIVAEACMEIFDQDRLEICPWALREGVILDRLDHMAFVDHGAGPKHRRAPK